jgi:hypothetical protein
VPPPRPLGSAPGRGAGRRPLAPVAQPGPGTSSRSVLAHRRCLRELSHPDQPTPAAAEQDTTAKEDTAKKDTAEKDTEDTVAPVRELRIVARTRERYQAITALHAEGALIAAIARPLGVDRHTVRRFVRAPQPRTAAGQDPAARQPARRIHRLPAPALDPGLHRRRRPTKEITALGYRGSDQTVRRYLHPLRDGRPVPPARPAAPTVRDVTGWIMRRPHRPLNPRSPLTSRQNRPAVANPRISD